MALALELERMFREGKHFLGDEHWIVKADHKETEETQQFDAWGENAAEVRIVIREMLDDEKRPYKWKLRVNKNVRGLGRGHSWASLDLVQLQDDPKKKVKRGEVSHH